MGLEDRLDGLSLPPGRIRRGDGGASARWVSDGPASAALWRAVSVEQGLCPLVLGHDGPWDSGELVVAGAGDHDAAVLLPMWWHEHAGESDEDEFTAPFGRDWPGFALVLPLRDEPDGTAFARRSTSRSARRTSGRTWTSRRWKRMRRGWSGRTRGRSGGISLPT